MSKQNAKKAIFKTPVGVAQYPWLNTPDTQFDTAGQYKVNLRLSPEDAKPLMEEVREAAKEAFGEKAKSATMPFVQDADTGEYIFKTKSRYQPKACELDWQGHSDRSAAADFRRLRDVSGWNPLPVSGRWPSRDFDAAGSRAAGEAV